MELRKSEGVPILLVVGAVGAALFIIFFYFLTGTLAYMYADIGADTAYSYYPNIIYFNDRIHRGDFSLWSPEMGLGSSLLSAATLFLDPFNWLLFIAPASWVKSGLAWIACLKILACSILGYCLGRLQLCDRRSSVLLGIVLALNGYTLVLGQHYFFLTGYLLTLLLITALELGIRRSRFLPLVLAVAISLFASFYYFYMAAVFLAAYCFVRGLFSSQTFMRLLKISPHLLIAGALGLGLAAIIGLPIFSLLQESPRLASRGFMEQLKPIDGPLLITYILRVFSPNSFGVGSAYHGPINYYEAPMLFMAAPVTVFALFFISAVARAAPVRVLTLVVLLLAGLYFDAIPIAMNGFQYPMYRWCHLLIIGTSLLGAHGLTVLCERDCQRSCYACAGIAVALALCAGVIILLKNTLRLENIWELYLYVICSMATGALLLRQMSRLGYLCLLVIALSATVPGLYTATNRPGVLLKEGTRVTEKVREPVESIMRNDPGVYRIHTNEFASYTESLEFNYLGLPLYSSLSEPGYVEWTERLGTGFTRDSKNLIAGPPETRPRLLWLLGVRYFFTSQQDSRPPNYYEHDKVGNMTVYKSEAQAHLGYAFSHVLREQAFMDLMKTCGDNAFIVAAAIADAEQAMDESSLAKPSCDSAHVDHLAIPPPIEILNYKNGAIQARFDNSSGKYKLAFLSIPYSRGWSARVNGQPTQIQKTNFGLIGIPLAAGTNNISMMFVQQGIGVGSSIAGISLVLVIILIYLSCRPSSRQVSFSNSSAGG